MSLQPLPSLHLRAEDVTAGTTGAPTGTLTVALAGNPNSGKTTLFNALTGLRQKVANYPGVTVEKKTGRCRCGEREVEVIDLPGTYSLVATSPDEQVAMEVIRGLRSDTPAPDVVVAVIDASNLARNLYFMTQLLDTDRPLVVALTMSDVANRRDQPVDSQALAQLLGVPVVPVIAHQRIGTDLLKDAIVRAPAGQTRVNPPWRSRALSTAELAIASAIDPTRDAGQRRLLARRLLIGDPSADLATWRHQPAVHQAIAEAAQILDGDPLLADVAARYAWIDSVIPTLMRARRPGRVHISERADRILLNRWAGYGIFAAVMTLLFITIFLVADPLMSSFEGAVQWLGAWATSGMADGDLKSLLVDGVFAGVGGVVVFVPQIALLFLFLAILEDTGYLARAAFLMDRILCRVGLHGKSFIPLLSSFACAIPGILSTRTIESRRERLATVLVAPFMSCSARLPVYGLVVATCFAPWSPWAKGFLMLGLYVLGIVTAFAAAWVGSKIRGRMQPTPFILELPTYQVPQLRQVLLTVWHNTWAFLKRAGTIIFALSILVWAMTTYPKAPDSLLQTKRAEFERAWQTPTDLAGEAAAQAKVDAWDKIASQENIDHSIAGRIGHVIEPVIAPIGFDWKIGIGLVGAFAAREVFVSTLGITYGVGDPGDDTAPLSERLLSDTRPDGTPVWSVATALSLLVWFVLAMQCLSTSATVRRETGGWTWPLIQLGLMNGIAWICCFAVYQVAVRFT